MTDTTKTAPIPSGRYGAPVPAPNTPTECPRCGAPAISRQGVARHALWHRDADVDAKRQEKLLDRLETFLNGIEHLETADGQPQKFPDWKREIDDLVAELPETEGLARLEQLIEPETFEKLLELSRAEAPTTAAEAAPAPHIIAWPEDEDVYAPAEQDDRAEALDRTAAELGDGRPYGAAAMDRALASVPDLGDALAGEPDEDGADGADEVGPWGVR